MHSTFCKVTMNICDDNGRMNIPNAQPTMPANEKIHADGDFSFEAQPGYLRISNQQV